MSKTNKHRKTKLVTNNPFFLWELQSFVFNRLKNNNKAQHKIQTNPCRVTDTHLRSTKLSLSLFPSPLPTPRKKTGRTPTLVGKGHSSSSSAMTAGPRGSSRGMTRISDLTTFSQPVSQSATLCSITMARGGSWSLHTQCLQVSSNQAQHHNNTFHNN